MTVFVLGAGASVHAGYPLASALGEELYRWAITSCQAQGKVRQLAGDIEPIHERFRNFSDFEFILTTLSKEAPTNVQSRVALHAIEVLVPEFFWHISQTKIANDHYGELAQNRVRAGDMVLTFNYDLACEKALRHAGLWEIDKGYGFDVPLGQLPPTKVKALKLHGSINWLGLIFGGSNGGGYASSVYGPRPCLFGKRYFSFFDYPQEIVDPLCQGISHTGGEPALILPAFGKIFHHQTYFGDEWKDFWDHIWGLAAEAVRAADEIVVIGYSMPKADERARKLLLKESNRMAEIRVFSGNATRNIYDEFREQSFEKIGSNDAGYFEDYLNS
jgi:hypothetical protein